MCPYHEGELAVQRRAGVRAGSDRIARSVRDILPPPARTFLEQARFAVVSTTDDDGRPWASLITGSPRAVRVVDERVVELVGRPAPGDPLADNLRTSRWVGIVAIDFATRRRMRANGILERTTTGSSLVRLNEVYSNCPKHIQPRVVVEDEPSSRPPRIRTGETLRREQRSTIGSADTFFLATVHPSHGADASHRGGEPGFVEVRGDTLLWPDYAGNMMFNSLGNLEAFPWAGLLFSDFQRGTTLQVVGRATVLWNDKYVARYPGAERVVRLDVAEVVEIQGAFSLRLLPARSSDGPPSDRG